MCTRHGFVVVLIEVQSAVELYERSLKKLKPILQLTPNDGKGKWSGENASAVQYWPLLWRTSFNIMLSDWNIAFGFGSFYFVVHSEVKIQNNKPSNDATHTEWFSRAETLSRPENREKNPIICDAKFFNMGVFLNEYWFLIIWIWIRFLETMNMQIWNV